MSLHYVLAYRVYGIFSQFLCWQFPGHFFLILFFFYGGIFKLGPHCGLTVLFHAPVFFCTPVNCLLTITFQVKAWFLTTSSSCTAARTSAQVGPILVVGVGQYNHTPTSALSHSSPESIVELSVSLSVPTGIPLMILGVVASPVPPHCKAKAPCC